MSISADEPQALVAGLEFESNGGAAVGLEREGFGERAASSLEGCRARKVVVRCTELLKIWAASRACEWRLEGIRERNGSSCDGEAGEA